MKDKKAYFGTLHQSCGQAEVCSVQVYPYDDSKNLFGRITKYKKDHGLTWEEVEQIFRAGCEDCGAWEFPQA